MASGAASNIGASVLNIGAASAAAFLRWSSTHFTLHGSLVIDSFTLAGWVYIGHFIAFVHRLVYILIFKLILILITCFHVHSQLSLKCGNSLPSVKISYTSY